MQFHGGAHCGNTTPRISVAADLKEKGFPPGRRDAHGAKTAKTRPTLVRGLLGALLRTP
jgi:hypothetical protein